MTLEEQLRDAAKRGELNYISVIPSKEGFCATYAPASQCVHAVARDADPVAAIQRAIAGWKPGKKNAKAFLVDEPPAKRKRGGKAAPDLDFG